MATSAVRTQAQPFHMRRPRAQCLPRLAAAPQVSRVLHASARAGPSARNTPAPHRAGGQKAGLHPGTLLCPDLRGQAEVTWAGAPHSGLRASEVGSGQVRTWDAKHQPALSASARPPESLRRSEAGRGGRRSPVPRARQNPQLSAFPAHSHPRGRPLRATDPPPCAVDDVASGPSPSVHLGPDQEREPDQHDRPEALKWPPPGGRRKSRLDVSRKKKQGGWCIFNQKRKLEHRLVQREDHVKTERRQPSVRQGERPQKKPTTSTH
ncbi:uncharacterized protein [Equus caballus]|uniref:uncharacterized protein isoform X2 n=1 Tax=Equus caballus TaxID=9796 RepID=UPI0038B29CDD